MTEKWWHDKVAYQIYPKSFYDTNGDGIGDIKGIIKKLDYLKELGIDIIWISPIYCSPFVDQGYDISDYYNIDPMFGTMDDMDKLLEETKKRKMYVVMDLVVNHCSDQHEWFQKALADPEGEYADYFYIKDGKDGQPPCNWRSYFGGSVWEPIAGTSKYYLHLFAKEQPDLNWENEVVRKKIYKMINWWLDKGLAGFRIDAIINIKKDLRFQDYKPDREDGLSSVQQMLEHATGVQELLNELKEETFAKYDAFTVGELFDYKKEELALYIGEDGCFSSIFDFDTDLIGGSEKGWYDRKPVTANAYRDTVIASQQTSDGIGMLANIIENHDEPRGVSRYLPEDECCDASKKMLAMLMMMVKGIPFIYQGQEIGMTNNKFTSIDDIDDISSKEEYRIALEAGKTKEEALHVICAYSRDNARTPMQWSEGVSAGFTNGTPWLELNRNYNEINVEGQLTDETSVWNFYKKLIHLRKTDDYRETIVYGEFQSVYENIDNLFAFYRRGKEKTLLVMANYQNSICSLAFEAEFEQVLVNNYEEFECNAGCVTLKPYQAVILEIN